MAGVSHLDEIIDYKRKVIDMLGKSQKVVGLLLDNPTIDMSSSEAYTVFDNNLFDYNYIDSTAQTATSYIMVEVDTITSSPTMKNIYLYVQVVVPKELMKLDTKKFNRVKGNRKDNLTRQVDLLLNNSNEYGIGNLELLKVIQADVPEKYTSRLLVYKVPNFARDRKIGNV